MKNIQQLFLLMIIFVGFQSNKIHGMFGFNLGLNNTVSPKELQQIKSFERWTEFNHRSNVLEAEGSAGNKVEPKVKPGNIEQHVPSTLLAAAIRINMSNESNKNGER